MEVVRAGAERIDDVLDLWAVLHRHHASVNTLGPMRSEAQSVRRARDWIGTWLPDGFVLLAQDRGRVVAASWRWSGTPD